MECAKSEGGITTALGATRVWNKLLQGREHFSCVPRHDADSSDCFFRLDFQTTANHGKPRQTAANHGKPRQIMANRATSVRNQVLQVREHFSCVPRHEADSSDYFFRGLPWFAAVCRGLPWFAAVCRGLKMHAKKAVAGIRMVSGDTGKVFPAL